MFDMYNASQTILQLCNEMQKFGYPNKEIDLAYDAYLFAIHHISGWYRGDGKALSSHLIGTSSILCQQKSSIVEILSGLLHAVPEDGLFPIWTNPYHLISCKFGEQVSQMIYTYLHCKYNYTAQHLLGLLCGNYSSISSEYAKSIVKIRLANELEDYMDNAISYYSIDGSKGKLWRHAYLKKNISDFIFIFSQINCAAFVKYFEILQLSIDDPKPLFSPKAAFTDDGRMGFICQRYHPKGRLQKSLNLLKRFKRFRAKK